MQSKTRPSRSQRPSEARPSEGLTTAAAADYLSARFPGDRPDYWRRFLANNRREDRPQAHRIPFSRRRGDVIYTRTALDEFAKFEDRRRITGERRPGDRSADLLIAYGIGTPSGGPYGKQLNYSLSVESSEAGPYVQLVVKNPLLVFCIPPSQVRELADLFSDAAASMKDIGTW